MRRFISDLSTNWTLLAAVIFVFVLPTTAMAAGNLSIQTGGEIGTSGTNNQSEATLTDNFTQSPSDLLYSNPANTYADGAKSIHNNREVR